MHSKDRCKLIANGFTLLRSDDNPMPRIKVDRSGNGSWATWKKFETKTARDKEIKRILEEEGKMIFD